MKQARVLTEKEFKRVLAVTASARHAARNKIALILSYYVGLRVAEISHLKWQDVLDNNGEIKDSVFLAPSYTKGNKSRTVFLSKQVQAELVKFRKSIALTTEYIICSQKQKRFSPNSLCQLFSRLYENAGLVGASSHSGRRYFITKLAHSGVSPKVIMELAGHSNLNTTQRYIEVNDQLKRNAVNLL